MKLPRIKREEIPHVGVGLGLCQATIHVLLVDDQIVVGPVFLRASIVVVERNAKHLGEIPAILILAHVGGAFGGIDAIAVKLYQPLILECPLGFTFCTAPVQKNRTTPN